jgi:hypothetical protein
MAFDFFPYFNPSKIIRLTPQLGLAARWRLPNFSSEDLKFTGRQERHCLPKVMAAVVVVAMANER